MFVAAVLMALQWLAAKKKKLIHEDEPCKSQLMGQQIIFFPVPMGAAMVAVHFINPQAGLHATAIVWLVLRAGQRICRRQTTSPAPSS